MKNNSIPYIRGYVNLKNTETIYTERENSLGRVAQTRKTTVNTYTINKADISHMSKYKNHFIGSIIGMMEPSLKRSILSEFLAKRSKSNIPMDVKSANQTISNVLADKYKVTVQAVNKVLKQLVDADIIRKLNRSQIMINPYYVVHNHISLGKIEELQVWWSSKPTKPIEWLSDETVDETVLTDLTKLESRIKQRQQDALDAAKNKALNDASDIAIINVAIPTLKQMVEYHGKQPSELELGHIRNYLAKKHPELCLTSLEPIKALLVQYDLQS